MKCQSRNDVTTMRGKAHSCLFVYGQLGNIQMFKKIPSRLPYVFELRFKLLFVDCQMSKEIIHV